MDGHGFLETSGSRHAAGASAPTSVEEARPGLGADQLAEITAAIDVLTQAVQFLMAERLNEQREETRDRLIGVLESSLSGSYIRDVPFPARDFRFQAAVTLSTVTAARRLMAGVRALLGLPQASAAPARAA